MLESGTARAFNLLGNETRGSVALDAQSPGHNQCVFTGRFIEETLIPKRVRPVLCKGKAVEDLEVRIAGRLLLAHAAIIRKRSAEKQIVNSEANPGSLRGD
jgi:hypothetical protein